MKTLRNLGLVAMSALPLLMGCSSDDSDADVVTLGLVIDLTDQLAHHGAAIEKAALLAETHINEAGGIHGKDVVIEVRDTQLDAEKGAEFAQELVDGGILGLIGEISSSNTMAIATEVTKDAAILQCTGASTSPAISDHDDGGYLYRTVISDAYQGIVLADLVDEEGHTNVAVLYEEGAYGQGLHDVFKEQFESHGGEVSVAISHTGEPEDGDADLQQVADAGATAIVLVSYETAASVYIQSATSGLDGVTFYTTDSLRSEELAKNLGEGLLEGIKGTSPGAIASDAQDSFATDYEDRFSEAPGTFSDEYYDCAVTLALALNKAGEGASGSDVKAALMEVANDGGTEVTYGDLKTAFDALAAGDDVNYVGLGQIELDDNGDQLVGVVDVYQYDSEGSPQTIDSVDVGP